MDEFEEINKSHVVYHKFYDWLVKKYGKDLYTEDIVTFKDDKGKIVKYKMKSYNEFELGNRLVGYECIRSIEKYVKRYCPDIKIVRCDDESYASSIILLIPHINHGIRMLFIPQCTKIQNEMFFYKNHYEKLLMALNEMKYVYNE